MIDHRQGAPAPAPQKGEYDQALGRSRGGLDKNPRDRRRAWHSRSVSTLATLTTSPTRNRWRPKSSPAPFLPTRDMMSTASSTALECAPSKLSSRQINRQGQTSLRLGTLRRVQSRRAVQFPQALSSYCDTPRQDRAQLPCRTAAGLRTR